MPGCPSPMCRWNPIFFGCGGLYLLPRASSWIWRGCVKKFEPIPSVNIVEEAATQFTCKERPTLQTFSKCAKEGFAWWPIFEHNIAGQEPHFFRVQKGVSTPQNVGATMGRCVDYSPPHPQFGEVHPCWAEFSISRTELYKSSTTTLERCPQIGKAFRLSHLSEKCGIVWPGMLLTVSQAEMKGMCYVGPYDPRNRAIGPWRYGFTRREKTLKFGLSRTLNIL